jgi:hypothetical protein
MGNDAVARVEPRQAGPEAAQALLHLGRGGEGLGLQRSLREAGREVIQQRRFTLDTAADLRLQRERIGDQLAALLVALGLLGAAQPGQHRSDEGE